MATDKQVEANRQNAQQSTGPRTPEGKARSSRNAFKKALTARQVVVHSESDREFTRHAASLRRHFTPANPVEALLVDQIAVAAWRLRRAHLIETLYLLQRVDKLEENKEGYVKLDNQLALAYRQDTAGANTIAKLSRYESQIERTLSRSLNDLDRRQARRHASEKTEQTQKQTQNEPNSPTPTAPAGTLEPPCAPLAID